MNKSKKNKSRTMKEEKSIFHLIRRDVVSCCSTFGFRLLVETYQPKSFACTSTQQALLPRLCCRRFALPEFRPQQKSGIVDCVPIFSSNKATLGATRAHDDINQVLGNIHRSGAKLPANFCASLQQQTRALQPPAAHVNSQLL